MASSLHIEQATLVVNFQGVRIFISNVNELFLFFFFVALVYHSVV